MRYVSIDIETSGLFPEHHQILEFAAVIDDTLLPSIPIEELPTFRRIIRTDRISGHPRALAMNANLITSIAHAMESNEKREDFCGVALLANHFAKFLTDNGWEKSKSQKFEFVAAGKNFSGFDRAFLDAVPKWKNIHQPRRRTLDPAILYFDPQRDETPPSLRECLRRAGLNTEVYHEAVEDARDVIRLLRIKFAGMSNG